MAADSQELTSNELTDGLSRGEIELLSSLLRKRIRARRELRKLIGAERLERIAQLRLMGYTYRDVGRQVGMSHEGVRKAWQQLLKVGEESAQDRILEHDARLDHLYRQAQRRVMAGEPRAIEVAAQVLKQKADLWGMDAPKHLEARIDGSGPATRIEFIVESLPQSGDLIDLPFTALPEAANGHGGDDAISGNGRSNGHGEDVAGPDMGSGTDSEKGRRPAG